MKYGLSARQETHFNSVVAVQLMAPFYQVLDSLYDIFVSPITFRSQYFAGHWRRKVVKTKDKPLLWVSLDKAK